jgi:hypothetical protein
MGIIFLILSLIGFGIHLFFTKKTRTRKYIIEILLSYLILFGWGFGGLLCFFAQVFFPYSTAARLGWEGGSPFQFQVGIAYLSFGVIAILSILIRMTHFWLATIIVNSIFYWGIAIGHLRQMIITHKVMLGNTGIYFYHDVVYPILIIGLYIWLMLIKKEKLI